MNKNLEIIKTIKAGGFDIIVQDNLDGGLLYELGDSSIRDEWAHIYKIKDNQYEVYFYVHNITRNCENMDEAENCAVLGIISHRVELDNQ